MSRESIKDYYLNKGKQKMGYKRFVVNSVTVLSQSVSTEDTALSSSFSSSVSVLSSSVSGSIFNLSSSTATTITNLSSSFTASMNSLSSSFSSSQAALSSSISGTINSLNTQVVTPTVNLVSVSDMDLANGNRYFYKTASGSLTWTFSNTPLTGAIVAVLELTNGGTGTQTWPSGTKWPGGTAPTLTTSGIDVLAFLTDDGGTAWRGVALMLDSK